MSFIEHGTPNKVSSFFPALIFLSASFACLIARSSVTVIKDLILSSVFSTLFKQASVNSTDENSLFFKPVLASKIVSSFKFISLFVNTKGFINF